MGTFQTMSLQWNLEIMYAWAVWGLWLKVDSDVPEDTFHMPPTMWSGQNQQPHRPLNILLNLKKAGCYQALLRRVSQRIWMLCSRMGPLKLKQTESNSRELRGEESSTKGRQHTFPCNPGVQGKNRAKLHSAPFQRAYLKSTLNPTACSWSSSEALALCLLLLSNIFHRGSKWAEAAHQKPPEFSNMLCHTLVAVPLHQNLPELSKSDLIMSQRGRRAHSIVPLIIFPRRYLLKTGTSSLTHFPVSRSHLLMQQEANPGQATRQKPPKEEMAGDNTGTGTLWVH